ncbi:MAG: MBL fold metallo-hydrolase [Gammaproteobacteria bacterium]|nr:MAG: MBL fold metallo-hydrolase [Gammaproteobacteria bacterium]
MRISFYGVRGSLPSPGPATAHFGGNTSCVLVELADGTLLIFDAGTGLRPLGEHMAAIDKPLHLLLTHSHWDHIQGFPFFTPIYQPDREIHICRSLPEGDTEFAGVLEQMNGHNHPLSYSTLPAAIGYMKDPPAFFDRYDFGFRRKTLNHPGGGYAYRIDEAGAAFAYVTDNELDPPENPATSFGEWVDFCHRADVLIHDAQYVESDMPMKHGWGHSLVSQVRELAHEADVGCLIIYHHDPERTDLEVAKILDESRDWFARRGGRTQVVCAWEGLVIDVGRGAGQRTRIDINALRPSGLVVPEGSIRS